MNKIEQVFDEAITAWRTNRGIGTALIPPPLDDKLFVLGVLQRYYAATPDNKCIIVTPDFNERSKIIEYLTTKNVDEENNEEFKELIKNRNILVFTQDYIEKIEKNINNKFVIWYRPTSISLKTIVFIRNSIFKLIVLNKRLENPNDMLFIYNNAPLIPTFTQANIDEIRVSTPVEEMLIPIDIIPDSPDEKLLNYYNDYITTSFNIFGSFEIMKEANTGNQSLNISSNQICYNIALENGWNEHLDMSIEFNQEIDKLYNPMNIKDRAFTTYEMIRNRSQLLSSYDGKLEYIKDIVKENLDKKILIINKRASFASKVTEYLNNNSETIICLNYHDKVDYIPAVDINDEPVFYKSGQNKGKRKIMGSKSQRTYAEGKFNRGDINVLSTNCSPDKDLNIDIDLIIITSPMCESIKSYIYRLTKCNFNNSGLKLYSLYCKNTQEEKLIQNKELLANHNVKNSISDENNCDFIVID